MIKNINKICKLICSINFVYNKSCDNKTQGSGLFINSCHLLHHFLLLDANLLHDLITGRSVTAVLHFFNLTPGNWYSKRQATVENATYGSEFVAAKTATEQIIDIRQTLRYLGVPIKSKAYMFGDNSLL